jgi:hypothetical protein
MIIIFGFAERLFWLFVASFLRFQARKSCLNSVLSHETLVLVVCCFFSLLPSEEELFKQCVIARGVTIASVIVEVMR